MVARTDLYLQLNDQVLPKVLVVCVPQIDSLKFNRSIDSILLA